MARKSGADRALFCDINVLVRLLIDSPSEQGLAAQRALDTPGRVLLTDVVVAELTYVLTSYYELSAADAADRILSVLAISSIEVTDELLIVDAIRLWSAGRLDFPDAYLAALDRASSDTGVLSFDRDFDRIDGVERVDPAQY